MIMKNDYLCVVKSGFDVFVKIEPVADIHQRSSNAKIGPAQDHLQEKRGLYALRRS